MRDTHHLYTFAPEGQIYVCGACGKTSQTRSGATANGLADVEKSRGWDESCMLNAVLCYAEKLDGIWQAVPMDGAH